MGNRYFSVRIPNRTPIRRPRKRSQTFKSEESAKSWAEKQGMKNYKLVNLRGPFSKEKKIKVVVQ